MKTTYFKNIFAAGTLLVCTTFCSAQIIPLNEASSFYMGKRNSIAIDIITNFINHPNKSTSSSNLKTNLRPKVFGRISFNRATSNGKSFSLLYSRDRTSRRQIGNVVFRKSDGNVWSQEVGNPLYIRNSIGAKINYHFPERGNIAPLGNHIGLGFRWHLVHTDYSNYTLNPVSHTTESLNLQEYEESYQYLTLDLAYTYRTMFTKKLYFDMAINGALPIHYRPNPYTQETGEQRLQKQLFESIKNRYKRTDVGSLSLGLGIIL